MGVPGPLPHRLARPGRLAGQAGRGGDPLRSDRHREAARRRRGRACARPACKIDKEQIEGRAESSKLERDAAMARVELERRRAVPEEGRGDLLARRDHRVGDRRGARRRARRPRRGGSRRTRETLTGTESALLQIKIRQADAKIQQARQGLQALTVTAPHDGVLILKRNWRGETVAGGRHGVERPAAGRDPRPLGDGGRGLRAGGGRRRARAGQPGDGDGGVRPGRRPTRRRSRGSTRSPSRASRARRSSTSPSPSRSTEDRSQGDEAGPAGAGDAPPRGAQGRPAGAAPGGVRARGADGGVPPQGPGASSR